MKRLLLFSFLLTISLCHSQEKAITGHWVLEKVEYENEDDSVINESSHSQRWIIFEKNYTLKHGLHPDQVSNTGRWEYDKKNNLLIIYFDNSLKPEGDKIVWVLERLNKNEMIVGGKHPFIHFKKVNK